MTQTAPHSAPPPVNALSVDVEDYFQVQAFAGVIPRAAWEALPRRVEANTTRILDSFAVAGVRATFFTLAWVAERHPALVRRIIADGHELASHGCEHVRADAVDLAGLRADLGRSKRVLEDIGGVEVKGYRAPTFSIGPRNPWAFEALAAEGYRYSSSVFPIRHDNYGAPDAPRVPYQPRGGPVWELPLTTLRLGGRNLPCAGGGWFRLLPYPLFRAALRQVNGAEGSRGIFYFHPWEIDPDQPRVNNAPALSRFRHRVNLAAMEGRIHRLLADFAWDRLDRVFAPELGTPA